MKVLIVDGFTHTALGREGFKEFKYAIEKSLEKPYYNFLCDVHYAVRSASALHDVVFDQENHNSPYQDPDSLKSFSACDLVFVAGNDASYMPWGPQNYALRLLLKQCINNSKPTFVCGNMTHLLVFLVQQRGNDIRVFNGRGRGGPLQDLKQLSSGTRNALSEFDSFLDAATGDVWRKHQDYMGAIKQAGNVGIYNPLIIGSQPATSSSSLPKKMGGLHTYKHTMEPFAARKNEVLVELTHSKHVHHWLLQNLHQPISFVAKNTNVWRISEKTLNPLFNVYLHNVNGSARSPQLISLRDILVAADFQVELKYPETLTLLDNWVSHVADRTRNSLSGFAMGSLPPNTLEDPSRKTGQSHVAEAWKTKLLEEKKKREERKKAIFKESLQGRTQQDIEKENFEKDLRRLRATAAEGSHGDSRGTAVTNLDAAEEYSEPAWTIKQTFLKHDEDDFSTQRTFNKVEIRKMLHPDMDINEIVPYVPEKVVRVVHDSRPFSRWKHFQTLAQRVNSAPHETQRAVTAGGGIRPSSQYATARPRTGGARHYMKRPTTESGVRVMPAFL